MTEDTSGLLDVCWRAGEWWGVGQCFANQELVHIPGDSVRPVVIANDIPVY
jgi:hypothetical protein